MIDNLNIFISFFAGFLSFFSPCVVVIIPIFLSNLAGVPFGKELGSTVLRRHVLYSTFSFILGFILVFTVFGILSGLFAQTFAAYIGGFNLVAGILIISFGLVTLEIIPLNLLQRTFKVQVSAAGSYNLVKSFLVGTAFAAGWTPCVGPILAAILLLAGADSTSATGGVYLVFYGLGLAIPFVFFAFFITSVSGWLKKYSYLLRYFNWIAGGFLIALGLLLISGRLGQIAAYFYFLIPPSV